MPLADPDSTSQSSAASAALLIGLALACWTVPRQSRCLQIGPGEQAALPEATGKTPCGRVVGIIRRNWRTRGYAGSLQVCGSELCCYLSWLAQLLA